MNDPNRNDPERVQAFMMAALDGELSVKDQAELQEMLDSDAALRAEWERLQTVKEVTTSMTYREPPEEVWDQYWDSVYNQTERKIGWLFLSAGLFVVFGWAIWRWIDLLLADTALPWIVRAGIFGAVFGGGVLFVSVAREKWFTRKRDPYKEIQR